MHELGIIVHITKTLGELAVENKVSGIVPDYLTDCWQYYRKRDELIKDSELKIELLPATTYCEDCEKTYPTVKYGRECPYCHGPHTYLLEGNECNIKEIEAC